MQAIKTLIADADASARARLTALVGERDDVELVRVCKTGKEVVECLRTNPPELLIQDVAFPDLSVEELLNVLRTQVIPGLVFVTASDVHAVEAFALRVADYVLKPFSDERFLNALNIAQRWVILSRLGLHTDRLQGLLDGGDGEAILAVKTRAEISSPYLRRLAVRTGRTITIIKVEDLDYIEAAGVYVDLHVGRKSYLLRGSLGNLDERLDPNQFVRIHRSTIINLDRVQELLPRSHGEYTVHLTTGVRLKLSRSRRAALERLLGRL